MAGRGLNVVWVIILIEQARWHGSESGQQKRRKTSGNEGDANIIKFSGYLKNISFPADAGVSENVPGLRRQIS
jgi:hypothetical protein